MKLETEKSKQGKELLEKERPGKQKLQKEKFGKEKRLLKSSQFGDVFDKNTSRSADDCWLLLAKPNGLVHSRLGLVISKKISKKAVQRNRLKRIARESFRLVDNWNFPGADIIILGRRDTASLENQALKKSLDKHWKRIQKRLLSEQNTKKCPNEKKTDKVKTNGK